MVHLEVAGTDMKLPPPRPMSISRKKQLANKIMKYASEHAMLREVEDIKQILHCHIVGMPVEIKKTEEDNKQVARPIFHCSTCFEFWKTTGEIRVHCNEQYKPVKGPVILLSAGAASLIKSVWTKRDHSKKPLTGQTDIEEEATKPLKLEEPQDEVDDIISEISDYDDGSVVLEHIAEGIVRNAGFEENVLRTATREIAENLALIISGKKPDDTAMMELIEKYLGETDLMILRGMIEAGNINDMKILKEKSGFQKVQIDNQHEKASKLLDRLAVLKTKESNGFKNEKVVYLTELFNVKGGKDKRMIDTSFDKRGNLGSKFKGKNGSYIDTGSNIQLNMDASAEDFIFKCAGKSDEALAGQKLGRAAGGKFGHQKLVKNTHLYTRQDGHEETEIDNVDIIKNTVKVENVHGWQKDDKQQTEEDKYSVDEFKENINSHKQKEIVQKSHHTYMSQDHVNEKTLSKGTKSKVSVASSSSTLQYQGSISSSNTMAKVHSKHTKKGISRNKESSKGAKKSLHKVAKPKMHAKSQKGEQKAEFGTKKQINTKNLQKEAYYSPIRSLSNTVEHVVYDIDDEDDIDDKEETNDLDVETFMIPGSHGYSDSTYNYLVDEFVTHYEKMSVDENGQPMSINVDNLRQQMQHGVVKKTGLSRKPVLRSESDEKIVEMFRAGSTVNIEQLFLPEDRNNNQSDISYAIPSSTCGLLEETKEETQHKRTIKKHTKKVRAEKPKRVIKRNSVVETTDSEYTDSDSSEIHENYDKEVESPTTNTKNGNIANQVSKKQTDVKLREHIKKSLVSPSVENNMLSSKSSFQENSSSTKHIAVAETHFGMQLDALANLPAVPNAADLQAKRKKSLGPSTRTKIVSNIPKEAVKAYHSRQIENANFSGGSNVPEKDMTEEIIESKTEISTADTEPKRREIKKKMPVKLGMSRKTDSRRKMSRGESVLRSVTSVTSRPGSSKMPLPPIHKMSQEILRRETISPELYEQELCPTMMEKPIAVVKPLTVTKGEIYYAKAEVEEQENLEQTDYVPAASPTEEVIDEQIHERPKIYIPESEISILSFTPSFSFSLFSLPNQYRKQNDDVKNAVYKVGKTQPKEATQELLARIPTRDKNKNRVQSKTNKIVNGLNKRVLRKVADPKPIARYVKKLDMVKEEQPVDVDMSASRNMKSQVNISNSEQASSSHIADIGINMEDVHVISDTHIFSNENIRSVKAALEDPFHNRKAAFASVPIESQMHLANAESVLIKVQEYV